MNGFNYPKGSDWRKWDLHIHSKSDPRYKFSSNSAISDREKDDVEYPRTFIEYIYSIENLGAIAITDHDKAEWIDKIIDENEKYAVQFNKQIIAIFPGVEIETSDGIHILVIFNSKSQKEDVLKNYMKPTWRETIDHFITSIENPSSSNASKTTEEVLEVAQKWDAVCIFAHVTEDKGFFNISSGIRKTKIYKHVLTQIFQIPKDGVGNNGYSNIMNGQDSNYGNKAICKITASDAKSLKDIGTNSCWIKADPTFEGLKQIIYEPEERVYIGEEPPFKIERGKVIKSITVVNSNKWFEDSKPIQLNEGLVSVIGGKGTGKTAILDLIAYAAGSYKYSENDKNNTSFLKKAFKELRGMKVKLVWEDSMSDEEYIGEKLEQPAKEGKVMYLPQDYVEKLCSELGKSQLENQIEDVIFQKIPPENKATFTDFKSYKDAQLKVINGKKVMIEQEIEKINSEIYNCKFLVESKKSKNVEKGKVEGEIKKFSEEIRKISEIAKDSKKQTEVLDKLQSDNEQKSDLEKTISQFRNKLLRIEEIENEISIFIEKGETFSDKLRNDLKYIGIEQSEIEKIKVVLYPENIEQILEKNKKSIENEIKNKKTELDKIGENINKLNSRITLEKSKQDKVKELNKLLSESKKKKDSLDEYLEKINEAESKLPKLLKKRKALFINYFEIIFEEKDKLAEIYSPLENILQGSREENKKLFDFTVQFNFDLSSMAEGYELIDLRAEGKFRQSRPDMLMEELEKLRFSLHLDNNEVSKDDKKSIERFLKGVEKLFTEDGKTIISQLKKGKYTEQNFDNWLYSTKYYSVNYSIKFNSIDLENLSPGLKGVALLTLFLELDEEDKRPILIDQPEENLDNRSVYITLMKYFREAKRRRQVIIVTHNPNLVVNTDSEQVIVANFDKVLENQPSKISYVSGSLENTFKDTSKSTILEKQGIREHVCEILEGGKEAFEKREKKYGF